MNVGDSWGLLAALAARHGLPGDQRQEAFVATRTYMSGEAACRSNLRSVLPC